MKILLLGKDGQVGWELQRALAPLGELRALGRVDADFTDPESLRAVVRAFAPDVIVNAAAYTAVDKAESDAAMAHNVNAVSPGVLAEEAAAGNAWLVHYSTDYVFDGTKEGAWVETDAVNPLSVYGRTKYDGEQRIAASGARHLILRTSWVFAPRGGNFARTMLRLAKERDTLSVVADQHGAPTGAELLADVTALALHRIAALGPDARALSGVYHLAAAGSTTWHAYAQHVLAQAQSHGAVLKAGPDAVQPIAASAFPTPAARPANSRLDCSKFSTSFDLVLPDWRHHVNRLIAELSAQGNL
jgi:dTDP-4-dehydrorhamnose reductase